MAYIMGWSEGGMKNSISHPPFGSLPRHWNVNYPLKLEFLSSTGTPTDRLRRGAVAVPCAKDLTNGAGRKLRGWEKF